MLLTVLGLLIIAGIIAYLFGGTGGIALQVSLFLAILLFVGMVGGIAMVSSRKSTLRQTGKVLLVIVAIIVLLPVAVIIFFFAICAAGLVTWGH